MLQQRTSVQWYAWIWYFMSHRKMQYIVTPCSASEYRKYDICQGFITGMCQDMSCIRSRPQNHITSHCITPGDVHFSLGLSMGVTIVYGLARIVVSPQYMVQPGCGCHCSIWSGQGVGVTIIFGWARLLMQVSLYILCYKICWSPQQGGPSRYWW